MESTGPNPEDSRGKLLERVALGLSLIAVLVSVAAVWHQVLDNVDDEEDEETQFAAGRPWLSPGPSNLRPGDGEKDWIDWREFSNGGHRPLRYLSEQTFVTDLEFNFSSTNSPIRFPNWIFPGQVFFLEKPMEADNSGPVPALLVMRYFRYEDALTNEQFQQCFFFNWPGAERGSAAVEMGFATEMQAEDMRHDLVRKGLWPSENLDCNSDLD